MTETLDLPARASFQSHRTTNSSSNLLPRAPPRSPTGNVEEGKAGPMAGRTPTMRSQSPKKFNLVSFLRAIPTAIQALSTTVPRFLRSLSKPAEEVGEIPGVKASLRAIVFCSKFNLLLLCIPVEWALHIAVPDQYLAIFTIGFLAIIPLAKLLAFATDDLSLRLGEALAGLVNATLGNAVELIVAVIALRKCELGIVQSSLIGSMLSNLLLVLGMCFFTGGVKFSEQGFGLGAAQLNSSLLALSAACVLLPTLYSIVERPTLPPMDILATLKPEDPQAVQLRSDITAIMAHLQAKILKFSHGIAILMLLIYVCYITFQLGSHTAMFKDDSADIVKSTKYKQRTPPPPPRSDNVEMLDIPKVAEPEEIDSPASASEMGEAEEGGIESPQMNGWVCLGLLLVVTVLVGVTAEFLVDSINGLTESGPLSKEFVGIVLLPIVGNAAEHVSAVTVAYKDKLTLSIGVAVGSSIQIALFVIPFIVVVAWGMGKPLTLLFDPFEVACLMLAILTVNYVLQDGKSNWLEGMILMCLYLILGTVFFFYPGMETAVHFAAC